MLKTFFFLILRNSQLFSHEIKRHLLLERKAMTNLGSILKIEKWLCQQSPYSQSYGFSSSHVWIWYLDCKEGLAPKNWCFQIVVLEKTIESPLDNKEIKLINPEKINSIFTDEAEAPIVWPLVGKDPDAGKDWGKQEKGVTEDVLGGWHHRLNGHVFEQTLGNSERQGSLACCTS